MPKKNRKVGRGHPAEKHTKKNNNSFFKGLRTKTKKFLSNLRRIIDRDTPTITRVLTIVKDVATIVVIINSIFG